MAQEQSYSIVQANDEKYVVEKSPSLSSVSASSDLPLEPQYTAPIERWMESLAESIRSSEGSQKILQKEEATFFGKNAFSAYEKAQTDYSLVAQRAACTHAHQNILQKLYEGKQTLATQQATADVFTAEITAQLKAALLEKEAQVHQLKEQRVVLEHERAQLTAEVTAHQSKAEALAQDIVHQQVQQIVLIKRSLDLAEQQVSKLETLRQKLSDLKALRSDWSTYEELLSDIKSKTQQLRKIIAEASPSSVEYCHELILDLEKLYHRCYGEIIRLTTEAAVAYHIPLPSTHVEGGAINVSDVTIEAGGAVRFGHVINITNIYQTAEEERAKAKQDMQEQHQRYAVLAAELANTQRIYEEIKTLLAKREGELSSLTARAHALSIEWEKHLVEVLQKQKNEDAEKNALQAEKNKLSDQLQVKTQEAAEQSLQTEHMKEAFMKQAAEQSQKLANAQQEAMSAAEQVQKLQEKQTLQPPEGEKELKIEEKEVAQLLQHVAYAEQDEAEALIRNNLKLLQYKGDVTDLSKRTFTGITAFQYALWALDWHMWKMLLRYLPPLEAYAQFNELERMGTAHGKEVSWQGLIDAYTLFQTNWDAATWYQKVGGAQLLLPAHVANEYCHPTRPLNPLPDFTTSPPGKGGRAFYAPTCGVSAAWWRGHTTANPTAAQLITDSVGAWGSTLSRSQCMQMDASAMYALYTTRVQQKLELHKTLSVDLQLEEVKKSQIAVQMEQMKKDSSKQIAELTEKLASAMAACGLFAASQANHPPEEKEVDVSEADKQTFFKHIANAECEQADVMLKANLDLVKVRGTITDPSGRTFENMTGFQYALWALDWHMWSMLLKYLPADEAVSQWKVLETEGTAHGKQVSWQRLIEAYAFYQSNPSENAWCHQVGAAQLLLPAHVANDYFHPTRQFYPIPNFTISTPGVGGLTLYNSACSVSGAWARCNGSAPSLVSSEANQRWYPSTKGSDAAVFSVLLATRCQQRAELNGQMLSTFLKHEEEKKNQMLAQREKYISKQL